MKNKAAVELGKLGGKARLTKMTKEERKEVARKGGLQKGINHKLKKGNIMKGLIALIMLFSLANVLYSETYRSYNADGSMTTTQKVGNSVYSYDTNGNYSNSQQIGNTVHTYTNGSYSYQQYIPINPPMVQTPQSYQIQTIGNMDYVTGSKGYQGTGQRIGNQYYYNDNGK